MKKILVLALALGGCAHKAWVAGPNVPPQLTYEQVAANCRMMARGTATGVMAAGSPAFVGGALVGSAIGNGVKVAANFDDCMLASGYLPAPEQ